MSARRRSVLASLALAGLGVVVIAAAVLVTRPDAPITDRVAILVPGAREMAATRTSVPWLPTRLVAALCRADDPSIVFVFEPVGLPLEMLRSYAGSSLAPPVDMPDPAVGIVAMTEDEFQDWLAGEPTFPCA